MNKNKPYHSNKSKTDTNDSKSNKEKPKSWKTLLVKFIVLFIVVASVVIYTDTKGYFEPDQKNNHTSQKWDSFYKFTESDTVDVVMVGNSHLYTGVNPKNLSAALGVNCFILASPGTTIMDSFYCLKEALERTQPKVAIIETYGINSNVNHKLKGGGLSDQFKSFNARKNSLIKLTSMPSLFVPEYYLAAWSKTLRNHDFIFRDREQIKKNIKIKQQKAKNNKKLYLGRFVTYTSGIQDSTLAKYNSLGAPVDGTEQVLSNESYRYVKKIVKLCEKHGVTPVFVTLPMYYKHIKNYPAWKQFMASAIEPTGADWLNMQEPYDTTTFDRHCFENTIKQNQHMTYVGSIRATYKIAHFLVDSLKLDLPERYKTQNWNDMFYGEEGYFENHPSKKNDSVNIMICQNQKCGNIHVNDCIMIKKDKRNDILVKIKKDKKLQDAKNIRVTAVVKHKGKKIHTRFDCKKLTDYDPLNHDLYSVSLLKDVELLSIKDITIK